VGILHDKSLMLLLKTSVQNALQKHKEALIVQRVVQNSEKSLKYKVALLFLPQGMLAQNAASLLVQNRLINLLYLQETEKQHHVKIFLKRQQSSYPFPVHGQELNPGGPDRWLPLFRTALPLLMERGSAT